MNYTYLIGWSVVDKWYYGLRDSKGVEPKDDLWILYKTSSKHVKSLVEESGEPDVVEIRKIFDSIEQAREWEHKVLRRLKVIKSDKWVNKTDNKAIDRRGVKHSDETRAKLSEKRKGRTPNLGNKHSEETKQLLSSQRVGNQYRKGMLHSEETKAKMRESRAKYLEQTPNRDPVVVAKIAERNKGKKRTPEQIERIRNGALNRNKKEKVS